jgi:HEPN domain-containing protein
MADPLLSLLREWCGKANEDLTAAQVLAERELHGVALFHCQQAVEKAIKAFLLFHAQDLPKTHDLVRLINIASTVDSRWADWLELGDVLTQYAVEVRYPGAGAQTFTECSEYIERTRLFLHAAAVRIPSEATLGFESFR